MDKTTLDNRSKQLNPNNPSYRGGTVSHGYDGNKAALDNRSRQLNPNNPVYWSSRGTSSAEPPVVEETSSSGSWCNIL